MVMYKDKKKDPFRGAGAGRSSRSGVCHVVWKREEVMALCSTVVCGEF